MFSVVGKSEMGRGTFGQVYMAVYKPNGMLCAAKLQPIDCSTVTREVELLRVLKADPHPNTISLYDVRVDLAVQPPQLLLLCELCDMDLKRYMKARGGLGPTWACLALMASGKRQAASKHRPPNSSRAAPAPASSQVSLQRKSWACWLGRCLRASATFTGSRSYTGT
jgi:hypothetical protein